MGGPAASTQAIRSNLGGSIFARIPQHREECSGKGILGGRGRDMSEGPDVLRIQVFQVGSAIVRVSRTEELGDEPGGALEG